MAGLAVVFGVMLASIALVMGFGHVPGFDTGAIGVLVIGVVLAISGLLTMAKPDMRMHAMHLAALAGLVGVGWGIWLWIRSTGGPGPYWPGIAVGSTSGLFVILCVRSFISARRARQAAD